MAPVNLVILGATGDLTRRLLMPALYRLDRLGHIPGLKIIGYSREGWTAQYFREQIHQGLRKFAPDYDNAQAQRFCSRMEYLAGGLAASEMDQLKQEVKGPALFYLALPPFLFGRAALALGEAGLADIRNGWRRLVVEKPFGSDQVSAEALRVQIHSKWTEDQVCRIDHFLGKESTQNLMVFRFANRFLEPLWNSSHISQVQISWPETLGVEHRAAYYDKSGALRDMLQNHLMQLFCLTAMEPPASWDAEVLRNHKVEVLRAVKQLPPRKLRQAVARGQYAAGKIGRRKLPGYLDEPGIPEDSVTETFAALRLEISNWRWQGVPFYLRSGKRMAGDGAEIAVQFRRVPDVLPGGRTVSNNWMIFKLQPNQSMNLLVNAKVPGAELDTRTVTLTAPYACEPDREFSAYEQLLLDALEGDRSHFLRFDEVEWSWRILDPVLRCWKRGSPETYPAGSEGPAAQHRILLPGHFWRPILPPVRE